MDKKYSSLDDILNDVEFGDDFSIKASTSAITTDDRLIESFNEINKFIDANGYEPNNMFDITERKLAKRLEGIRSDPEKVSLLTPYDTHNLFNIQIKSIESLDDILSDDFLADVLQEKDLGLDIFELKHVQHSSERQDSEYIARRKPCKYFAKYEPLIKQCQADIKAGKRSLVVFDEKNLVENTFFILNGQLGFLEKKTEPVKRGGNRSDSRVYCIFENATESNMQFLSLAARLYQARKTNQAFTISQTQEEATTKFIQGFNIIQEEDKSTGYIYILTSKSTNPKIADITNLYKIGYSTVEVEDRVKMAATEATYLMAEVEIVSVFECYNLNPQKFEHIIHTVFATSCLNLDIFGKDGKRHNPREWFIVPLEVILQVIPLVISGEIVNYIYDSINQRMICS